MWRHQRFLVAAAVLVTVVPSVALAATGGRLAATPKHVRSHQLHPHGAAGPPGNEPSAKPSRAFLRFRAALAAARALQPAPQPAAGTTPGTQRQAQQTTTCTRYASPSGSASGAGTQAAPYATLQQLVSQLQPGETGCLESGTYSGDATFAHGGTADQPVTLKADDGAQAIVRGKLWIMDSADYVDVTGLVFDNPVMGVSDLLVEGDHVQVSNSDFSSNNTGICILLGGEMGTAVDTTLTGNRIHNCGPLPAQNHGHGIYIENTVGAVISDNWIYDNADRGIQLYPNAQHSLIENNVIDGNGEGVIFSGDGEHTSNDNVVTRNIITNSRVRADVEDWWGGAVGTGNVSQGNCLWNSTQPDDVHHDGFTSTGNIEADPLYVDRANHDYRLQPGSPCAGLGPR